MTYDLESLGLQILIGFSVGFGAVVQVIAGERARPWLGLIAGIGWLVGGLVGSEVVVGTMTVEEIQPIIGGLAFDEALLGGLIGGLVAASATWLAIRERTPAAPQGLARLG
jgi:hypothetical protein